MLVYFCFSIFSSIVLFYSFLYVLFVLVFLFVIILTMFLSCSTIVSFILYFCFVFTWFYSLSHLSFHYFSSSPLFFRFLFLIIIPSLLSILSMLVSDSNFVQFSRFSAVLRYCCSFPAFLCPSPFADFPRLFANSTSHFPKVNK